MVVWHGVARAGTQTLIVDIRGSLGADQLGIVESRIHVGVITWKAVDPVHWFVDLAVVDSISVEAAVMVGDVIEFWARLWQSLWRDCGIAATSKIVGIVGVSR